MRHRRNVVYHAHNGMVCQKDEEFICHIKTELKNYMIWF
jgi:hypothetical protein